MLCWVNGSVENNVELGFGWKVVGIALIKEECG
jgi:hypothetical protein